MLLDLLLGSGISSSGLGCLCLSETLHLHLAMLVLLSRHGLWSHVLLTSHGTAGPAPVSLPVQSLQVSLLVLHPHIVCKLLKSPALRHLRLVVLLRRALRLLLRRRAIGLRVGSLEILLWCGWLGRLLLNANLGSKHWDVIVFIRRLLGVDPGLVRLLTIHLRCQK